MIFIVLYIVIIIALFYNHETVSTFNLVGTGDESASGSSGPDNTMYAVLHIMVILFLL